MMGIILYCVIMYVLAGLGTSLGYHRVLTHRSVEMPKMVEYVFVLIGLPAGTPIQWVGNHRAHHANSDNEGDPHSPILDGFWYAHCGWYIQSRNKVACVSYALAGPFRMLIDSILRPRTNQQYIYLAKDIQAQRFYSFISKPIVYMLLMWFYVSIVLIIPYLIFGWIGVGCASLMLVLIYNVGDALDSFGHLYGKKLGKDHSRNNSVLGIMAFGDGWHANHHLEPRRAKHGIDKYQLDLTYLVLRFGKFIRVIKKIH